LQLSAILHQTTTATTAEPVTSGIPLPLSAPRGYETPCLHHYTHYTDFSSLLLFT